jgi:hypothetical protein
MVADRKLRLYLDTMIPSYLVREGLAGQLGGNIL